MRSRNSHAPETDRFNFSVHVQLPNRSSRVAVHGIGYLVPKSSVTVHDTRAYEVYGSSSFVNIVTSSSTRNRYTAGQICELSSRNSNASVIYVQT